MNNLSRWEKEAHRGVKLGSFPLEAALKLRWCNRTSSTSAWSAVQGKIENSLREVLKLEEIAGSD